MKIYVFGNRDVGNDNAAIEVADKLSGKIKGIEFVTVKPNEDLPFVDQDNVVLMDVVQGIKKVTLINESSLENSMSHLAGIPSATSEVLKDRSVKFVTNKSVSVHDWDLGFQLKYLKKLGRLKTITIIGLPMEGKIKISLIKNLILELLNG